MVVSFKLPKESLIYRVNFETYNMASKSPQNTLSYICEVRQEGETLKGYKVSFKRTDILLNKTKTHAVIDQISLIAGELINDLELVISTDGKILQIKNLKAIQKKWERIKFKIEYTYLGDITPRIIEGLKKNVFDEKQFINSLYKDSFFLHFLATIYQDYPNDKLSLTDKLKDFAGLKDINLNKEYSIAKKEDSSLTIKTTGILTTESKDRIRQEKGVEDVDLSLNSIYQLSPKKYLTQIKSDLKLSLNDELFASQKLRIKLKNTRL